MRIVVPVIMSSLAMGCVAIPASAQEVFGGLYRHAVDTPFTLDTGERGIDVQAGWRGARSAALRVIGRPQPYAFLSVNTRGDTSLAAAGLSWRLGSGPVFVRPGIGVAIHDGPGWRVGARDLRTDLGSRVLFEPELGIGTRLSGRATVEAHWTHVSHAQLFGGQNPGLDIIGARVSWRLGA